MKCVYHGIIAAADIVQPEPVPTEALARVHTPEYLARLDSGSLSSAEIRRLGLPWSPALWQRSLLASGGTLLAAWTALAEGLAANLAGGTHHAFADHGEGFCVINDVAIAIRQLQARDAIRRALVIDLDVHQGNGTAAIFAGVDVAAGDRYGKLGLSDQGVRAREKYLVESVRSIGIPLVIVLGGGYATTRQRTAELHTHVFRAAVAYENAGQTSSVAPP